MVIKLKFKKGELVKKRLSFSFDHGTSYEYLIIIEKLEMRSLETVDRWCVWDPQSGVERVISETLLISAEIENG
jgi:hypothetical protein